MARTQLLNYGRQSVDESDVEAVVRVLQGDFLTTGPAVEAFEAAFSEVVGGAQSVACANGTAALHLAMMALGIGPGDCVIVPTVTFMASANAARLCGADVVFADVDPDTGLMEVEHLLAAFDHAGRPVKAVVPVHLAGRCADVSALAQLATERGAVLIEDACHALGTILDGTPVGICRHSVMTVFSFHPVKTIATGEGGMVTTGDPALARRLRLLRGHGIERDSACFQVTEQAIDDDGEVNPWYHEMHALSTNYRLDEMSCALGLSQLKRLPIFAAERRRLMARYRNALAALPQNFLSLPPERQGCDPVCHLSVVLIDFPALGKSRGTVMKALRARGIGTQVHYIPVHRQPYYRGLYGLTDLPSADRYYERCLSLPLYVGMTEADVDYVVEQLGELLAPSAE